MANTIVITRDDLDNDNNNSFTYNYPTGMLFDNHEIAVESVSINYAWANISAILNNNQFTYQWVARNEAGDADVTTTHTLTIQDGLYELADINARFQLEMIKNGHYLLNATGDYVFYAEWLVNPNTYKFDLVTYVVPTSLPSGFTTPVADAAAGTSAFVGFPLATFRPRIQMVSNNNFYKLVGFSPTFDSGLNVGATLNATHSSINAPQIHPNSNVFVSINKIENKYAQPSTIIHNVVPDTGFGQTIVDRPNQFAFVKLRKGNYAQLQLTLLGSDKTPLKNMLDPDIVIVLLIREATK
jgi:hypothetical protein